MAEAQNNAPHLYLFNQAASPFSSSAGEGGLLSSKILDPFAAPVARRDSGNPLRLMAGLTIPSGGNTRLNLSTGTAILNNSLYISLGYGGQNLGYKEMPANEDEANGFKSRALAFNILYQLKDLTLQAGGTQFNYRQDRTIQEQGFYSSFGASYSFFDRTGFVGLQLRGLPIGQSSQTVEYTELVDGQEFQRKETNRVKLPTQAVVPLAFLIEHNERLSAFLEVNGGYFLGNIPTNNSGKTTVGGMVRLEYKPFFVQTGYTNSGFTAGNFKSKIGVGAGVELKDFSIVYSYSTNQVYKSITMHSLGIALAIGSK